MSKIVAFDLGRLCPGPSQSPSSRCFDTFTTSESQSKVSTAHNGAERRKTPSGRPSGRTTIPRDLDIGNPDFPPSCYSGSFVSGLSQLQSEYVENVPIALRTFFEISSSKLFRPFTEDGLRVLHLAPKFDALLLIATLFPPSSRVYAGGEMSPKRHICPFLIIIDPLHSNFIEICEKMIDQHINLHGESILGNSVMIWETAVALMKGFLLPGMKAQWETNRIVANFSYISTRLLGKSNPKEILWHEYSHPGLLLHILDKKDGCFPIRAVSCIGAFSLVKGTRFGFEKHLRDPILNGGLMNTLTARNIPLLFVSQRTLGTDFLEKASHIPHFHHVWPFILARQAWEPQLRIAMDDLAIYTIRLRASCLRCWGSQAVELARQALTSINLDSSTTAVFDRSQYTRDKCSVQYTRNSLLSLAGKASVPINHCSEALLGTLLVGNELPDSMLALRVDIKSDGKRIRVNGSSQIYVAVTGDHKSLEKACLMPWYRLVETVGRNKATCMLPKNVIDPWHNLTGLLYHELEKVMNCNEFKNWVHWEKELLLEAMECLKDGSMTRMCQHAV